MHFFTIFLCGWDQFLLGKKGNLTAYFDFLGTASELPRYKSQTEKKVIKCLNTALDLNCED